MSQDTSTNPPSRLVAGDVQEHLLGAGVVLYGAARGALRVLDPASAFTWVAITEGSDLGAVTEGLVQKLGKVPENIVRGRVEALVASWVDAGLLVVAGSGSPAPPERSTENLATWSGALVGEDVRTAFVAVSADAATGLVAALLARGVAARTSTTVLQPAYSGDVQLLSGISGRVLEPSRVVFAAAGYPDIVALDPGAALAAALGGGLSASAGLTPREVEALLAWFDRGGMRCVFADNAESLERLVAVMAGGRVSASA